MVRKMVTWRGMMSRIGSNIYKRKDGRWEGRVKNGIKSGRTIYISVYGHSYSEVTHKMDQLRKKLSEEVHVSVKGKLLFKDACTMWIASIKERLKESSIVKYEDLMRCYIIPALGNRNISEITTDDLEALITDLGKRGGRSGKGLASSTLIQILSVANSIRKHALRKNYSVGYVVDTIEVRERKKDIRILSDIEIKKLVKYLKATVNDEKLNYKRRLTALGILIALYAGIREGELCALKWDDIDLQEMTMKISGTMRRLRVDDPQPGMAKTKVVITSPKSITSCREIPLPPFLVALIKPFYKKSAFILSNQNAQLVEPRTLQYRFKSILRKCSISDANFHVLRHTFATKSVEQDVDTKSLSEILGHASVVITMDMYVHPTRACKAACMEKLAAFFNSCT